ncbi:restriction endonuclease subunit S [Campylobacter upsaliensis]|uniref:restriction endonuclease subunit S n=1 Tax=Campylobacter upsaliensis TaxID=28080 RepID=UPI00214A6880|nr:restriction endonuclease subunit S [Campylobacter upsaliensis]MCR2091348.1 restriction endonuclease subunit S [Campylobacter upsaliensis]
MKKHTQSPYESSEISYKPSGIKWLGEIPKHWEICKLNKVSYFINGYAFESSHFDYSFSIPVIRIGDIQNDKIIYHTCLMTKEQENLKNFMIYRGDIVIALSGATTGKFAVCNSNKKAYINQRVAIIRSDIKILKYYLSTFGFVNYIDMLCNGSAQPNISTKEVGNFKIPLPPLQEQKEIAEFLDKKCEKIQNYIDKKQKLITLLQEKKQALINEVVTKGLNPNIEFKNSGIAYLGLIPHHWEVRRMKFMASIHNGREQTEIADENGIYPIYGSGGILGKSMYFIYDKPSVLLGRKGTIDKPLFVEEPFWTIDTMFYTSISKIVLPKYFYYLCLTIDFQFYISGSAIPSMTQYDLANISFALPPLQEQKQIANFLDEKCEKINSAIEKTKRQIELVKEYKNTFINEAVCGRINLQKKERI